MSVLWNNPVNPKAVRLLGRSAVGHWTFIRAVATPVPTVYPIPSHPINIIAIWCPKSRPTQPNRVWFKCSNVRLTVHPNVLYICSNMHTACRWSNLLKFTRYLNFFPSTIQKRHCLAQSFQMWRAGPFQLEKFTCQISAPLLFTQLRPRTESDISSS